MSKYTIGQKVMHPLHGIGTVENIEEKNVLGQTSKFSVIHFSTERLKIMVNIGQKSMIRGLISKDEVPRIFKAMMRCASLDLPSRSSERYNFNLKKIKSSDIYKMVEVIRDLTELNKRKKLSRREMTLLKQARKIFCSEVSYVNKISEEEAEELVEETVREAIEETVREAIEETVGEAISVV